MTGSALFARRMVRAGPADRWVHYGDIAIWPGRRLVRLRDGSIVGLTLSETVVLMTIIEAGGEPVSRDAIVAALGATKRGSRLADTHVCALRRKLQDDRREPIIVTVASVGYAIDLNQRKRVGRNSCRG